MKHNTYTCDACRKPIQCTPVRMDLGHPSFRGRNGIKNLDLCPDCWDSVRELLLKIGVML